MRRLAVAIGCVLLCVGCGSGTALLKSSLQVERGHSKEQVTGILGVPGDRQFNGDDEAWQYCRTGMNTDQFVVVWFYQGRVTGVTTYRLGLGSYVGSCTQGYKTVRWEDAPDRTIEIRAR